MTIRGPEERERFARRDEAGLPLTSARSEHDQATSAKVVAGGSITEALCGVATVVLAIIALAGALPRYFAPIATIVLGAALVARGGAVAARFRELLHEASAYDRSSRVELGGGMGAELVGGVAGIVLGILALIGIATPVLSAIAVMVLGGALLLGSGETAELGHVDEPTKHLRFAHITHEATKAAAGIQVLAGASAVVLGILALAGFAPVDLTLVALLVLGTAVVLSSAAVSSRMASVMRR
ncbi:Hypothetical protein A7982_04687 [Minicystis rosea]|nr:Hypothetical protein A7982_04687 [Minicystis rosea]